MKLSKLLILPLLAFGVFACTDLEETLREDLTFEQAQKLGDAEALLLSVYEDLRGPFMGQEQYWATQEITADGVIPPTRGGDWDDNGKWRALHNHTYDGDHVDQTATFNNLLKVVFTATNVLSFNPTPQQAAEARFLRALAVFSVADAWDQVPVREPGDNLLLPPQVLSGTEAINFVIEELNDIMSDLPDAPVTRANKDAARVLLMKCYLNRGTIADRANPSFPADDMNQVISIADQITGYSLADNYFDNFAPQNNTISSEAIFLGENRGGTSSGNVRSRWFCTLHYNHTPGGWNGFATLADFYDKFDTNDSRKGMDYNGVTDVTGLRVGFLEGQQFDENGTALLDRKDNPLAFTREVALIESGNDLEVTGVRVVKYPPDYVNTGDHADNDYVFFRYADVLLMKAEALLRTSKEGDAVTIVNQIRTKRGAGMINSLSLDGMLDERAREMYWEGWRRQDLIRFGKFLEPWHEKPASKAAYLLNPIPNTALAVNPNLKQNSGH